MVKVKIITRINTAYLAKFFLLLALAIGAPLAGFHSQWITGPIVNAALILAVYLIGVRGALLIGLLPSTIALGVGLLPAILAPMIPFIIIANTILILVVDWVKRLNSTQEFSVRNYSAAIFFAAGLKYLFLYSTSALVIGLLVKQELRIAVSTIMSWPQFFTAVLGGLLAWTILIVVNLEYKKSQDS